MSHWIEYLVQLLAEFRSEVEFNDTHSFLLCSLVRGEPPDVLFSMRQFYRRTSRNRPVGPNRDFLQWGTGS